VPRFLFYIFFSLLSNSVIAQSFERIESLAGFDILSENSGVAVADYDGDLDLDIFVMAKAKDSPDRPKTISRLFRNNDNGTFTDVTSESGLTNLLGENEFGETFLGLSGFKYGVSWGDYDNDGFPDLFLTHVSKVQLFHNEGDGTFRETTAQSGLHVDQTCKNTSATWFDYNRDGWLDLYINDWGGCRENSLYRNNGDGTFQIITGIIGPVKADGSSLQSYMMLPFDVNGDGWQDMYVTNDFREPNTLFINEGGTGFREAAAEYGLDNRFDDMGVTLGDFDQDGTFDLFITGIRENRLFSRNDEGGYTDKSHELGLTETGWGWGALFADFDHDTDEDLYMVNGFSVADLSEQNIYFRNLHKEGTGGFEKASSVTGLSAATMSTEAIPFDYDNDGDLDLFVSNSDQPSFFYENKVINEQTSGSNSWLKLSLTGTGSNINGVGSRITAILDDGTILLRSYSGTGFLSQSIQPVHFGWQGTQKIRELRVEWPSGITDTYQNISANQWLNAKEDLNYEPLSKTPSIKTAGCTDPRACNYNPLATKSNLSCRYLAGSTDVFGKMRSGYHQLETYTYLNNTDSEVIWEVEGGEIISGQGTQSIQVRWGFGEKGTVSWHERNGDCESLTSFLEVELSFSEVDLNTLSVARIWNEALLQAIRTDLARPNVHARNLFHASIATYDTWAIFSNNARPYLVGQTLNNFSSDFQGFTAIDNSRESIDKAISFASYRLLSHRFAHAPASDEKQQFFRRIMEELGHDPDFNSMDYSDGNPAALGNFIGQTIIDYGLQDGAREATDYDNGSYEPVNSPLNLSDPGVSQTIDPNRWQPLQFRTFVDQSGNLFDEATPGFLGPEWGSVLPFAMTDNHLSTYVRNNHNYPVYHDPGSPPHLDTEASHISSRQYQWNFALVALWSGQLSPHDEVSWDISPGNMGNITVSEFPTSFDEFKSFYARTEQGIIGEGHAVNPITGRPYEPQFVPRGDFTRVLAEFWADGPDSETPPGHWFTILNYVNDHPEFSRKFEGQGSPLSTLEWDVKAYFALGGAMHDAAVAAWGIKGWYDYVRPITAIRFMSGLGQSSDPDLPNYHVGGIPLSPGHIELVGTEDPLRGFENEHVGKIKLFSWLGHERITNPDTDEAGVGWILAENWWPYQRPSFVTPPFAGYVSGHSTYSRAAAEVLTLLTGSAFFPGGLGEFTARKNEFLVFEKGPSTDVVLQWATYRDASDQTSLSRIWGGIHPPVDDIPGRRIGEKVGTDAYAHARSYFNLSDEPSEESDDFQVYPNPTSDRVLFVTNTTVNDSFSLFGTFSKQIPISVTFDATTRTSQVRFSEAISSGLYILSKNNKTKKIIIE